MLATQEAQVIPVTLMKHFCNLISELDRWLAEVVCDSVPLLTPALQADWKPEASEVPELTGLDFSWILWIRPTGSGAKKSVLVVVACPSQIVY